MKSSWRSAWILSAGLVVLSGCKSELDDKPAVEPLDDPWIDAIETGDEEPAVAIGPETLGAEPPTIAEPGSLPVAQPSEDEDEDEDEVEVEVEVEPTARSHGSAASSKAATAAAPEQPDAPAIDGQPAEPAPAPIAEPTPAPSAEPAEPAEPASPPPITSADFHGNYRYSGGSSQRAQLADAIEATVEQLPRAIRGIARRRLTATNPVDDSLDIVIAGNKITTTFKLSLNVTCVLDGATVNTTDIEGGKLKARVRSKGSKIIQRLEGRQGARTIVYVLSADRSKLTVHHKITADRLPAPITYRLTYSRK